MFKAEKDEWESCVAFMGTMKINRNRGGYMCFKLDNGSELFSIQEMHRLRKNSSGVMGSRSWVKKTGIEDAQSLENSDGAGSRQDERKRRDAVE
jgi:hypothetical protein